MTTDVLPSSSTLPGATTFPGLSGDPHSRSIFRGGVKEYIRGRVTAIETAPEGPVDRSTLVSGTYNPVYYSGTPAQGGNYLTNRVGYYGPSSLTSESEGPNLTFSTNGQVVNSTAFYRRVTNAAQGPIFNNCLFLGSPTDPQSPLICNNSSFNPTFNDCTFAPMSPQYNTYCARGGLGGGTFNRCDFYGGVDGFSNSSTSGWPQQWNFNQCAFHDMVYMSPDPDGAGGLADNASHVDDIQWGGGRLKIEGCGFWSFYDMTKYQAPEPDTSFGSGTTTASPRGYPYHFHGNKYTDTVAVAGDARTPPAVVGSPSIYSLSTIMFSPIYRNVEYFEMNNCYMDGSTYALNMGNTAVNISAGNFKFTNNRIGTNHRWSLNGGHKAIVARSAIHGLMTITGNTDLATGAALTSGDILQNG